MTKSAGPVLDDLHSEYGDRVGFVSLYVREAHPGDRYPQPSTFDQKMAHATDYEEQRNIDWPVAVDDIEGSLHSQLDPRPHAAYVMAADGTVAGRALWANDRRALSRLLDAALADQHVEITNRLVPMLRGTGFMYEVWNEAGGHARTDVRKEAPPMFLTGWVADHLRPLPPLARGAVAMATTTVAPVLGAAWFLKRRAADGHRAR